MKALYDLLNGKAFALLLRQSIHRQLIRILKHLIFDNTLLHLTVIALLKAVLYHPRPKYSQKNNKNRCRDKKQFPR